MSKFLVKLAKFILPIHPVPKDINMGVFVKEVISFNFQIGPQNMQ